MGTVHIHEAKTRLSWLIERACAGEEIIMARNGKPIARFAPIEQPRLRRSGLLKGKAWVAKDFNAPLPDDLLDLFEGKGEPKRKAPSR